MEQVVIVLILLNVVPGYEAIHSTISNDGHRGSNGEVHKLEKYPVNPEDVSVSGFSSGGAMAMLFHFIHSKILRGAGIFSGSPYLCAEFYDQLNVCRNHPENIDSGKLIDFATSLGQKEIIDRTTNLENQPVFIYHGSKDTVIPPEDGQKILEMYEHFGASVNHNFHIAADHGMPTTNFGVPCGQFALSSHFITDCDYPGAFQVLNHLNKHRLRRPLSSLPRGNLIKFNQDEFMDDGDAPKHSMNSTGYIYVPQACTTAQGRAYGNHDGSYSHQNPGYGGKCKLHIVFHGCLEYSGLIDEIYIQETGYLQTADENEIILLFPQTISNTLLGNPDGCWDVWGYDGPKYFTKEGHQVNAIYRMVQRIRFG